MIHLPLEPYPNRYTWELSDAERYAFESLGTKLYSVVPALDTVSAVTMGKVIDPARRPLWTFNQVATTLDILKANRSDQPAIYLSDFFTPGIEALWYARHSAPVFAFCWAQTADEYDFTRTYGPLMRHWEQMAMAHYHKVFVASAELAGRMIVAFPEHADKVINLGGRLPYDAVSMCKLYGLPGPYAFDELEISWMNHKQHRPYDLVFTSRWVPEKRPDMFLKLLDAEPLLKGLVLSGDPYVMQSIKTSLEAPLATRLMQSGRLTVHGGLTRQQYFNYLKGCKAQVNTSLQDWVSFTLLDSLCAGCIPVYPNQRSFPEVFAMANDRGRSAYVYMYLGQNVEDMQQLLRRQEHIHDIDSDGFNNFYEARSNILRWVTACPRAIAMNVNTYMEQWKSRV